VHCEQLHQLKSTTPSSDTGGGNNESNGATTRGLRSRGPHSRGRSSRRSSIPRECAVVELPSSRCFGSFNVSSQRCEWSDVMVATLLRCLGGVGDEYMHGGGNVYWQPKGAANEFA